MLERRRGAHIPYQGCEPVDGNTVIVCDAWPVRQSPTSLYRVFLVSEILKPFLTFRDIPLRAKTPV